MPVGEERLVKPISLSDGTLLFMYYKYPLSQAFGGVLAEPIIVLHERGEYRVRYESRDGEGRDRLEGARPIVTRDWVRSKWLNEYLVGLDELRLMASLGGRGGPERELYTILSEPTYRDRLACYASKFPDESGSRLIVLNWVGPLASSAGAGVKPAAVESRSAIVPPGASRVSGERPPAQRPRIEPPPGNRPSMVIPLAHQVPPKPPAPSPEAPRAHVSPPATPRQPVEADAAPRASKKVSGEDAGTRKLKLGLDSTQPVPVFSPSRPSPHPGTEAAQQSTAGPPAAPVVDRKRQMTQRTSAERPAADLPSTVIPLAHQVTPAPSAGAARSVAAPSPIEPPSSSGPLSPNEPPPIEPASSSEPLSPIEPPSSTAPPSPIEVRRPIEPPASVERQRAIVPSGALRSDVVPVRHPTVGRRSGAGEVGVGRNSTLPPSWMIAGVALFGLFLLMAGWWLRSASDQPTIAFPSRGTPTVEAANGSTGVTGSRPGPDHRAAPDPGVSPRDEVAQESPAADPGASEIAAAGGASPGNTMAGNTVAGKTVVGNAAADRVAPEGTPARPTAGGAGAPQQLRERPGQKAADEVEVARRNAPAASPKPRPSPPAPVAIETPLLAQGSAGTTSPPPAGVQDWEAEVPDEPQAGPDTAAKTPTAPVETVAPRSAPAPAAASVPALKITSAQMNEAQRNYLARVIRFLEPPLKYEWAPKYMRPAFFVSLVTDGEPPECRIDFKESTAITFDLIIRGGSGTESRIEDVELIYE